MATITVQPGVSGQPAAVDSWVNSSGLAQTTNYGTAATFKVGVEVGRATDNYRAFLKFDLSAVPRNAHVTKVVLTFQAASSQTDSDDKSMTVYRVDANWVENEITWVLSASGLLWNTAGGDTYSDRGTFTATMADGASFALTSTRSNRGLITLAQDALTRRKNILNILIRADTEGETMGFAIWDSGESGTDSRKPKIAITYQVKKRVRDRAMRRTTRGFFGR